MKVQNDVLMNPVDFGEHRKSTSGFMRMRRNNENANGHNSCKYETIFTKFEPEVQNHVSINPFDFGDNRESNSVLCACTETTKAQMAITHTNKNRSSPNLDRRSKTRFPGTPLFLVNIRS